MSISSSTNAVGTSTPVTSPHTIQSVHWNWPTAWIVLVVGLMLTAAATLTLKSSVERIAEQKFISHCNDIKNTVTNRLDDYTRILQGGAALFNASGMVTREEWHVFYQIQKIGEQLPFIQGIGFSLLIPREELARHTQEIRQAGFPEYRLKPDGNREIYTSIVYLEPFSGRNLRAFGYDMFTEPVRRTAMEQARDTNTATLSGKVILVQEDSAKVQAGTLIYVPVYRKGMPVNSVAQRRAAIYGWVYSPYRMNDLMQGILGGYKLEKEAHLHLQVFDGVQTSPQSLLFEYHPSGEQGPWTDMRFTRKIAVDFNNHRWTLNVTQVGGGFFSWEYISSWLVMVGGMFISLLLFALILTLLNTRAEAQRLADERTLQLTRMTQELSFILENAPIGISKTINRMQVWANRKMEDIFQYSKEETEFQTTRKLHPSDEAYEKLDQEAYPVLAQGLVFETEPDLIRKDGVHVLTRVIGKALEPQDLSKGIIWLIEDITERKQAEAALKESAEKFRTVADYTFGWEVWEDPRGAYLYCSPSCERVTGYSPAAFIADPGLLERLIHPDDLLKWKAHHATMHCNSGAQQETVTGAANELEFRILHSNGEVRWISHLCHHIFDTEGHDLGHRISKRDITERKHLEAEIVKSRNLESLGILAGGIAHDFNNLFQAIIGNLELANMTIEQSSKAVPFLATAVQMSGLATNLTNKLIAFSPGGNSSPVIIQPANLIREEVASTGSGLVAEFDLADNLWPIMVDPTQLRNVIKQMVQNAMEAMHLESGGQLRIMAINEPVPENHSKHPTLVPGNYVRISIQDQGCGISSENLPRIFDPYFSTKERGSQKGMGLGLALCDAIIRKHCGAIAVQSELGKGTTFHIYLPAVVKNSESGLATTQRVSNLTRNV